MHSNLHYECLHCNVTFIGIPVQCRPNGNKHRFPKRRWNPTANWKHLDRTVELSFTSASFCTYFTLWKRKSMSQVKASVHVWIGKSNHILFLSKNNNSLITAFKDDNMKKNAHFLSSDVMSGASCSNTFSRSHLSCINRSMRRSSFSFT